MDFNAINKKVDVDDPVAVAEYIKGLRGAARKFGMSRIRAYAIAREEERSRVHYETEQVEAELDEEKRRSLRLERQLMDEVAARARAERMHREAEEEVEQFRTRLVELESKKRRPPKRKAAEPDDPEQKEEKPPAPVKAPAKKRTSSRTRGKVK